MTKNPKLELTWIGKENRPRLEPRILLEDPEKSGQPLADAEVDGRAFSGRRQHRELPSERDL